MVPENLGWGGGYPLGSTLVYISKQGKVSSNNCDRETKIRKESLDINLLPRFPNSQIVSAKTKR